MGTGDGRAVLALARREPNALVLGVDASAAAMAESSRRAAGSSRKGGLPNERFILAAAEAMPSILRGTAARVTVTLPWGSLLRGCVGADDVVAEGVASLVAPGGALDLLLAPSMRDHLAGVPVEPNAIAHAVTGAYAERGLAIDVARPATPAELAASNSSWARRLGSQRPPDRAVMLVRLVRTPSVGLATEGSEDGITLAG